MKRQFLVTGDWGDGSGPENNLAACSQIAGYLEHMSGGAVKWAVEPTFWDGAELQPQFHTQFGPNPEQQAQRGIAIQHPDGAIEIPQQFDVDGRRVVEVRIHPEKGRKQAKCGNCLERYDITDDPVENHHRAMRHKLECQSKNEAMYSRTQRDNLLEEFHAQPNIVAQRQAWAAEEMLKLEAEEQHHPIGSQLMEANPTPERRPWWKIW